jgi:hypothetical protein
VLLQTLLFGAELRFLGLLAPRGMRNKRNVTLVPSFGARMQEFPDGMVLEKVASKMSDLCQHQTGDREDLS